jgi:hypothetical protein
MIEICDYDFAVLERIAPVDHEPARVERLKHIEKFD